MKTIRFVWSYLKSYKLKFISGLILAGISVIFILVLPQITQLFVDSVLDFSDSDPSQLSPFWIWITEIFGDFTFANLIISICLVFIVCALLKNVAESFSLRNLFSASSNSCGKMRRDCFRKLSQASSYPKKSEVFVYFTNDISDLFDLIFKSYPLFFTSILKTLLILIFLFFVEIEIGLCISVFIILMLIAGYFSSKKALKFFNEVRNRRSRMEEVAEEAVNEIKEIKIFNREEYAIKKFGIASANHYKSNIKSFSYLNKVTMITDFLKIAGFSIVVILSAIKCFDGTITVGFFVLILAYALLAVNSMQSLINSIHDINLRLVKISRVMNFIKERNPGKKINENLSEKLDIQINNVKILLNERKLFDDLNMNLDYGKTYGIVIKQGEGKSAFAKMLLRFFEVLEGDIQIGGQNIQDLNVCQLRNLFSFISQEPYIFEDTLLNNIILFDEYDEQKFQQTVEICGLEDLINKFPSKTEQNLKERGVGLSSQEKQYINFARAIYRNAPILLIDSSFNKFSKTISQKLLKKFLEFYKNRMVIILSQRLEDIEFCDEIIFIQHGKVGEKGNYKTLSANKGDFYKSFIRGKTQKKAKVKIGGQNE